MHAGQGFHGVDGVVDGEVIEVVHELARVAGEALQVGEAHDEFGEAVGEGTKGGAFAGALGDEFEDFACGERVGVTEVEGFAGCFGGAADGVHGVADEIDGDEVERFVAFAGHEDGHDRGHVDDGVHEVVGAGHFVDFAGAGIADDQTGAVDRDGQVGHGLLHGEFGLEFAFLVDVSEVLVLGQFVFHDDAGAVAGDEGGGEVVEAVEILHFVGGIDDVAGAVDVDFEGLGAVDA